METLRASAASISGRPGQPQPDSGRHRRTDSRPLLVAIDAMAAIIAVGVAYHGRLLGVVFAATVVVLGMPGRNRALRLTPSALDDAPALMARGIVIATALTALAVVVHGSSAIGADHSGLFVAAVTYGAIAIAGRAYAYGVLRRLRAYGRLASPALVVGTGPVGERIARRLMEHPEQGLVPMGFADSTAPLRPDRLPAPVLGDVTDLPDVIVRHGVSHVFVAFCRRPDADLVDAVRACYRLDCEIYVVPRLYELGMDYPSAADHLWGVPLMHVRQSPFRGGARIIKRPLDIAIAAVALVLTGPLMLAIALALRAELGPGVLFRQVRVGLDGQPFEMLKFRTLRPEPVGGPSVWSVVDSDRMGPFGRFLRRSSLDELPQLWNVLRGQMSIVGPRPEQVPYARRFARRYRGYPDRLRVPAGVTGWAQIHDLRGDTSIEDRVRFDNFYIEHWSLWQDVKIVTRTVASVFGMRGG